MWPSCRWRFSQVFARAQVKFLSVCHVEIPVCLCTCVSCGDTCVPVYLWICIADNVVYSCITYFEWRTVYACAEDCELSYRGHLYNFRHLVPHNNYYTVNSGSDKWVSVHNKQLLYPSSSAGPSPCPVMEAELIQVIATFISDREDISRSVFVVQCQVCLCYLWSFSIDLAISDIMTSRRLMN